MNRLLTAIAAVLLFASHPALAATPDLHDADATYAAFKSSQQSSYEAVDLQYRVAIAAAPGDVELGIARCRFLENFSYAEDIDWSDAAAENLASCHGDLARRWGGDPTVRVFELENSSDEAALPLAEKAWSESANWSTDLRTRIAARLHQLYKDHDNDKAGRFAVVAAQLGDPATVAAAIRYLAGKGQADQVTRLVRASKPATSAWMASQRISALSDMGEAKAARSEMERSVAAGLEMSPAEQVRVYLADHDLEAANHAAMKLNPRDDSKEARFELALANGELGKARSMVAFDAGFPTWIARYSKVVAKAPTSAFSPHLLPFTLAVILCILATALLPGLALVPVHYRGLMRRVRGRAPIPMFERIGLRHAWLAAGFILVIPALVMLAMRPDAIGAMFTGASQSASTQFSVVATGSLFTLFALLPWQRRLRMEPIPGRTALSLRAAAAVVGCWLVIYAVGVLSALVHHAMIGGDSSTLQTRTVETLVQNSSVQYGMVVTMLFIAGIVPIVEETIFRGMLLGGMSRHISFGWANFIQALLFATVHGDLPRFLVYLMLGLLTGWLARHYRSLLPAIALHALNNGVATLLHG